MIMNHKIELPYISGTLVWSWWDSDDCLISWVPAAHKAVREFYYDKCMGYHA